MRLQGLVLILAAGLPAMAATDTPQVTFNKDVAPILQKNCQGCHRPGEVAPMSFLTYQDVRPWAKAIREAVLIKRMPPWFADPHYGKWSNDRSLSRAEIDTLVTWADSGAAPRACQRGVANTDLQVPVNPAIENCGGPHP